MKTTVIHRTHRITLDCGGLSLYQDPDDGSWYICNGSGDRSRDGVELGIIAASSGKSIMEQLHELLSMIEAAIDIEANAAVAP